MEKVETQEIIKRKTWKNGDKETIIEPINGAGLKKGKTRRKRMRKAKEIKKKEKPKLREKNHI